MRSSYRGLSRFVAGAAFVLFAMVAPNCQPTGGDYTGPETGGSGGRANNGGNSNTGGSSARGGSSDTGGNSDNGGNSDTGGSSAKGGSGGSSNTGGSSSKGGSGGSSKSGGSSSGGNSNTGGTSSNGGSSSDGGNSNTGGTSSAGGSSGSTPTGTTVTFKNGKAQGAMTGYGYVALGKLDTVTSPTCGPSETEITSTKPCAADPNWSKTDALCISGSIPALDPDTPDYDGNWGESVGVNATDPDGKGLGQAFTSVTITTSGSPTSGLRAIAHLAGDSDSVQYCYEGFKSGTAIKFTEFTKTCYDTASPGTAISAAQVNEVDKIAVQVTSSQTAITVTDLCMTKIEFAK